MGGGRRISPIIFATGLLVLATAGPARAEKATLLFFWAVNCPHCLEARPVIEEMARRYDDLQLRQFEVWNHPENYRLMMDTAAELGYDRVMTPMVVLDRQIWFGFDDETAAAIEAAVNRLTGPREMGEMFKVMAVTGPVSEPA